MIIDDKLLNEIQVRAKASPRLRMNYNFHEHLEDTVQRLLNVLQVGSVLPVHRHRHTAETYVILRGRIEVQFYNERREIIERHILDPQEGQYGVHIPVGTWHTLEVLSDAVIFEVKEGPYMPNGPEDILE